jgi:NAD(P)H-flavin reductase
MNQAHRPRHAQTGLAPPASPPASPLNPDLLAASIARVTAIPQRVAGDFYGYLFATQPHLRAMFPPQMDKQNDRLFRALIRIAVLAANPARLTEYLTQLGADHRKYNVQPEHYEAVGAALLRTLRRHVPGLTADELDAWAAAYQMATGLMIGGAAGQSGPAWWSGRVIRHERRTDDLAVITIRTDEPLPYRPGQYVTVETGKWQRVWRPYSVAGAPRENGTELDLHVRRVSGGWVSTALVLDTLKDDRVRLGPALGSMTQDLANGHDLVCVAGGTGLAPLKAIVEGVLREDEDAVRAGTGRRRNIHLFTGASEPVRLYDHPALTELERAYPWLQVVPVISGGAAFRGEHGLVTDVAAGYQPWTAQEAFAAGPPGMIRAADRALSLAGLPVHFDEAGLGAPGI